MRFLLRTTLALGLAAITDSPMASESLAKTKGCLNCHGIDVAKR